MSKSSNWKEELYHGDCQKRFLLRWIVCNFQVELGSKEREFKKTSPLKIEIYYFSLDEGEGAKAAQEQDKELGCVHFTRVSIY